MQKKFKKYYGNQWLVAIVLGVLVPFGAQLLNVSGLNKVIWLYLVVNSSYMLYLGYITRKNGLFPLVLLTMPVFFTLISTSWLRLVSHQYGFYFGLLYIVLSLFTFLGDTRDDPDENMIPVEGGFHGLTEAGDEKYTVPVDGGFQS